MKNAYFVILVANGSAPSQKQHIQKESKPMEAYDCGPLTVILPRSAQSWTRMR